MNRRAFAAMLAAVVASVREFRSRAFAASSVPSPPTDLLVGGGPSVGLNGSLGTYQPFAGGQWYLNISSAPVDPNSASYISGDIGAGGYPQMRMEMGGGPEGGGIPYYVVDSTQSQFPLVPIIPTAWGSYSTDVCFAPIPILANVSNANAAVEGYPNEPVYPNTLSSDDQHVIVFDRATNISYELYKGWQSSGFWTAESYSVWNTDGGDVQRPYGHSSADVAGLSVFMGVGKGYQIINNQINCAMRVTCDTVGNCQYFWSPPAMNAQSSGSANQVPFGARIRLKSSVTIANPTSPYTPYLLTAWKTYGLINADGSSIFSAIGDTNPWNTNGNAWNDCLSLVASDWEVVDAGSQTVYTENGTYPSGAAPTVSLAVSATSVSLGSSVTVTPTFTNATMGLMCPLGGVKNSGAGIVCYPQRDTWYSLMANNPYGATPMVFQRVVVTNWAHSYPTPNIYISTSGSTSNTGLSASSPWPISVLGNSSYSYILRGAIIQLAAGTYNANGINLTNLYGIPSGPTVIQASGAVTINGGSSTIFTGSFTGLANIQLIGLTLVTTSAYAISFTGSNDTGILVDSCTFTNFGTAGASISGSASPSWTGIYFRNCSTTTAGYLCYIQNNVNALFTQASGSLFSGTYASYAVDDGGGNSGTLIN